MEDQKKDEKQESVPTEEQTQDSDQTCDQIKHPLQNKWTLWFYDGSRNGQYADNQHMLFTFSTIEDFWSLHNHIKPASQLRIGCDYAVFKNDIRPLWEDEANKKGGRWLIQIDKRQKDVDEYWLEVMLCLIGEAFDEYSDEVCGAVVNNRGKRDKISLWTADFQQTAPILHIGQKLKERLKINDSMVLMYQYHDDWAKNGATVKYRYRL